MSTMLSFSSKLSASTSLTRGEDTGWRERLEWCRSTWAAIVVASLPPTGHRVHLYLLPLLW